MLKTLLAAGSLSLAIIGLSACSDSQPKAAETTVQGELYYLPRIALSPDAVAQYTIVQLNENGESIELLQKTESLNGQQVPIPFTFTLETKADQEYAFNATIEDASGSTLWFNEAPSSFVADQANVDLGKIQLLPFEAETEQDSSSNHSSNLTSAVQQQRFRAVGNEPGWDMWLEKGRAQINLNYGADHYDVAFERPEASGDNLRYEGKSNELPVVVELLHQACSDTMADNMNFSYTVVLTVGEQSYQGCGDYLAPGETLQPNPAP